MSDLAKEIQSTFLTNSNVVASLSDIIRVDEGYYFPPSVIRIWREAKNAADLTRGKKGALAQVISMICRDDGIYTDPDYRPTSGIATLAAYRVIRDFVAHELRDRQIIQAPKQPAPIRKPFTPFSID